MDHDRRHGHHYVNGMTRPVERKKEHNYKLVVDPFLHKGHSQKVYRFDGVLPGENRVVSVRDPRSRITRLWTRQQQADLPVPKFKYDEFYIGVPPPKEVTFTNLNDNINKDFLENMCKGFGKMEETKIYFHPKTKKHIGIGKVLFCSSKAAKACVDKLNQTSKMGNIMNVFIDTMGRERNRIIEELTIERPKSSSTTGQDSRSSGPDEAVYPETEAYDPGDTFDMGMGLPEPEYTPSVETDYSGYSEGGYSVPQSEMSFSSQDTGYSSGNNVMGMGYQRDNYNQYSMEHHQLPGNKYYHRHQFGGGPHQQHHHHRHHQPPATPAHHHPPPQTPHSSSTPHYSVLGDMNNSRYGFYVPPPSPNTPFDRPPPPLPPELQPLIGIRPDHNFQDPRSYHGEPSRHNQSKQKRRPEREPLLPPPRPRTPEAESDEPRFESLESRIQSLLQNVHGLGSPDHASSSSQDEATPSHTSTQESSFEYHQPPAPEPLPPMPEHPPECEDVTRMSPMDKHGHRIKKETWISPVNHPVVEEPTHSGEQFEGLLMDSQTVVEETVNTEPCATPTAESVYNGTPRETTGEDMNVSEVSITPKPADGGADDEAGGNEEDDRMSLSSISSGEEKMEINAPLPATGTSSSSAAPTNFSQSPMQSVQSSSPAKVVTSSWQNNVYTDSPPTTNSAYGSLMGSPPVGFGGMTVPGYHVNMYGMSGPGSGLMGSRLDDNDPSDQTFSTVLDKFVKELKQVMQKDLCKKMVENSAFKSFENWWDTEVEKTKQPQKISAAEEIRTAVPTSTKAKPGVKPEMSASLASLFESKERPGLDSGMGYGGFLGIRGGMPKMPSFKRKFRPPSPPPEEDEDSRKPDSKSADEDSDREEVTGPKLKKPVISESDEEESESSDEEKDEESGDEEEDEDDEEEEGSGESSEEEESEEEESDESDLEEESEEEDEVKAATSDLGDKGSVEVKKQEERETPMEVETVEKSDEDADVDVVTSGDEDKSLHMDKDTDSSRDADDSEVSSMDTDEDASPSKDTPGKRPLSPIMEEREKEELESKKGASESEDKGETTATTTASEITDSSALDSDSSAVLPPGRMKSKVVKIIKVFTKDSVEKEVRPSEASPVLKDLIERGPMVTDKSSAEESEEMPSASVLTDGEGVGNEEEVEASSNKMSMSESEAEQRSHFMVPAIAEHDYFTFRPVEREDSAADSDRTESADEDSEPLSEHLMDHNYSLPPLVEQVRLTQLAVKEQEAKAREEAKETKKKAKGKKSRNTTLSDITNKTEKKISRELVNLLPPIKPIPKFRCRTIQEEREIFFDIYNRGIAEEDVRYLKRTYDDLIQSDDPNFYWLNDILWVDHTQTDIPDVLPISPPKKKKKAEDHVPKPHASGSARTEGYYKLSMLEKSGYLRHAHNLQIQQKAAEDLKKLQKIGKKGQTSREARHNNRRLQTTYSDLETDLLRFNQLKFRKKQLRFAKSGIHDWGLFALEPIASEEMVIEYVGQVVRQSMADERERKYEAVGIGSSYLFRVDTETIIDATKTGNLARFINHSCNPNCYAKIITVEAQKKIVIYSKRDIDVNEEITYDYKFPIEDEKIPCLCASSGCRGTLN